MTKRRLFGAFIFLWLILTACLSCEIAKRHSLLLLDISTLLVFTHILYGGYFLFKKESRIDVIVVTLSFLIYGCLFFFVKVATRPFLWFFWLQIIFICAMALHLYYKSKLKDIYLQEFCNYKLYVEISGIILSALGMLLYRLFPRHLFILEALILASLIKFNLSIFMKKKLYHIYYAPAGISKLPFVSIVIIAYNEEQYIGRLFESIKRQDYPEYEVILVDDHSTDRTVVIAKGFESDLPLQVVQKDIRGASRSRNFGATFAKGEVMLFLDADVVMPERFIAENIGVFREDKLSVATVDFIPESENKFDKFTIFIYRLWLKAVQYFNPRGIGFCLFVSKDLHKNILFDETIVMSEDFDYVRRAARHGKFRIISKAPIIVSWRRFQKENRFLLILKYIIFELYRQNIGEIRRKILPYEFGSPKATYK